MTPCNRSVLWRISRYCLISTILMISPSQYLFGEGLSIKPVQLSLGNANLPAQEFAVIYNSDPNQGAPDNITSHGDLAITWTAPGDDANIGTADHYIIRYSNSEINESNWNSAITISDPPTPLEAGSPQSYTIAGLSAGQYYYVAVKSVDEAGNISALSNVIGQYSSGIPSPILSGVEIDSATSSAVLRAEAINSQVSVFYEFALDTTVEFAAPVIQVGLAADSTVSSVFSDLSAEPQYFWRCRAMAVDYSDSSDWSDIGSFNLAQSDNIAPLAELISPNGHERWNAMSSQDIIWSDSDNIGVTAFMLEFTIDSGDNWQPLLDWTTVDPGSYNWTLPDLPSRRARVKFTCRDNAGNVSSDISDQNFTIRDVTRPRVHLIFPNGGDSLEIGVDTSITWQADDNVGIDSFMVEYSLNGGVDWNTGVNWTAGNPGSFDWAVPDIMTGQCLLRVSCVDPDSNISSDTSDSFIFLSDTMEPLVTITNPADGDSLQSDTVSISWDWQDNGALLGYAIGYSTDDGQNWEQIYEGYDDSRQYSWPAPQLGIDLDIRVLCADQSWNIGEDTVHFYLDPNVSIEGPVILPGDFFLSQSYPNPFNPSTTIKYGLPVGSQVTLEVYDILGNRVATLIDEYQQPGFYQQLWQPDGLSSGTYIYRIETSDFHKTGRATLIK